MPIIIKLSSSTDDENRAFVADVERVNAVAGRVIDSTSLRVTYRDRKHAQRTLCAPCFGRSDRTYGSGLARCRVLERPLISAVRYLQRRMYVRDRGPHKRT